MPALDDHDSYWGRMGDENPWQILNNAYGYSFSALSNRSTMKELMRTIRCGLQYEKFSRPELLKFLKDKQIEDCDEGFPNKYLIFRLRGLDNKQTFRYLDLPPELRERIAKHYIGEFSNTTLTSPTQPPLARTSRLVRREVLPLFYRFCTFRLVFDVQELHQGPKFLRMRDSTFAWMMRMEPQSLACIRNLVLQTSVTYDSFKIEVSLNSDGSCKDTTSKTWYASWQAKEACKSGLTKLMGEIGARDGPNRLRVDDIYRMRAILESKRAG